MGEHMAYLYEDKEHVYEKQMRALKKRVVLVNFIIFITNFIATLILIFNQMEMQDYLQLIIPVFILNLVISYAMVINRDSHQQLYLAMYISIIGVIVVVLNIFMIVQTPATYMLLYLAIAIISIYNDKKAVSIGYMIILIFGTIIHFRHTNLIIGYKSIDSNLTALLYESLLILTLVVQTARIFYNEAELDQLYDEVDNRKEKELKYHNLIFHLLEEKNRLFDFTDEYAQEETTERLKKYVDLFQSNFYLKEDLNEKLELYLSLQQQKDSRKVLGRRLVGYQLKREINQFNEMSTYKPSKYLSLLLSFKFNRLRYKETEQLSNFDLMFIDPEMSIEVKIIGFILLYDQLRTDQPFAKALTHDEIVASFKRIDVYENFDKEIVDFFLENADEFKNIFENIDAMEGNSTIQNDQNND